jgi:hypothetical protein
MRLVDRAVNSEVYTVGSTGRTGQCRRPASGFQGRVHYNHPFSAMPSGKIRRLPPRQKVPEPVNQV